MKTPHTQAIDAAIADAVAERQQTAENKLTSERACEIYSLRKTLLWYAPPRSSEAKKAEKTAESG